MRAALSLDERARRLGIARFWTDAAGKRQRVSDDSLAAIVEALGEGGGESEAEGPLVTAEVGEPVRLPTGIGLPPFAEPGYYDASGYRIAVAPPRGWTPQDAAPGRRLWGSAVQLPSLRDRRAEPFGDFTSLAAFAGQIGSRGGDLVAISPVHALFPADPGRFGPYGPSTRLFLNVVFADPGGASGEFDARPGAAGAGLIDWIPAMRDRLRRLRLRFARRGEAEREGVEHFRREQGDRLELHGLHDALHAHFLAATGARDWRQWPSAYQDPAGGGALAFGREHRDEVDFHVWLQWMARSGLERAQQAARQAGMAVGLVTDLAVGMDAGGSQAWSRRDALLRGLSVGAPPDPLGPDGQDWGITGFSPVALKRTGYEDYIATLRAVMSGVGGVRIDHAMGLKRLWVVPQGFPPTGGAYVALPERDLMRLLALESWRHRAIVVGEDLGTVPDGFRETMEERGFLGMRVLWFERDGEGGFVPPSRWTRAAAAMTSTHDLPTVAGWWSGTDIDWTWRIGRTSAHASERAEREARARDRSRLWQALAPDDSAPPPEEPEQAVTAAVRHVARSACEIALIPAEDLLGVRDQPNLPGTVDEHPNWRRRLPGEVETMFEAPEPAERVAALAEARPR